MLILGKFNLNKKSQTNPVRFTSQNTIRCVILRQSVYQKILLLIRNQYQYQYHRSLNYY